MSKKAGLTRKQRYWYDHILNGRLGQYQDPYMFRYKSGFNTSQTWQRSWAATYFAAEWHGRKEVDIGKLLGVALKSKDPECAIFFARNVPKANLKRIQEIIIRFGKPGQIREFAKIPGTNSGMLNRLADVAELFIV